MSTDPTPDTPSETPRPAGRTAWIGADWLAVIVSAVIVVLALIGLLPSIPFLVK